MVQAKPTRLDNLLLMFNIHALREQWDYLTIANKLPDVIELFSGANGGKVPNELELSEVTGLTRGQIRRCRLLFDLPQKYRASLEQELALPKHRQRISEDFFIEMERALKTEQARVPEAIVDIDSTRDVLIRKFRDKIINNVTDFRKMSKIATSVRNLGVKEKRAQQALSSIFDGTNGVGIDEVYAGQFEAKYDERRIAISVDSITEYIDTIIELDEVDTVAAPLRDKLARLRGLIEQVLRREDGV